MKLSPIVFSAKIFISTFFVLAFSTTVFPQFNEAVSQNTLHFYSGENVGSKLRTRPRIYVEPSKTTIETPAIPEKKAVSTFDLERLAFNLLNQKRVEFGLNPVVWSEEVARVARLHSLNMAKFNFFSHQGQDGLMIDDRAEASGLKDWRRIGENIAYNRGYENPVESAVLRWMESPSHRQNLLSNKWKESGVGIALAPDGKTYYFTQVFVLRK